MDPLPRRFSRRSHPKRLRYMRTMMRRGSATGGAFAADAETVAGGAVKRVHDGPDQR